MMRALLLKTIAVVSMLTAGSLAAAPAASAASGDPIGKLDSVSIIPGAGSLDPEENDRTIIFGVYGWAADPNDDDAHGSVSVHLYVNGRHAQHAGTGAQARPDVQRVHPWAGPNTGWSAGVTWPASESHPHRICAYAINEGAGANNTLLGCISVGPGSTSPGDPKAHLDVIDVAAGLIRVVGWAGDPDRPPDDQGQRITRVRVYYGGRPMTEIDASRPRPDVEAVFPSLGGATGFDETLPITVGRHFVCLYALNGGRSGVQNTTVGCRTVDVPHEAPATPRGPKGALDEIRHNGGLASARGWAFDPDGDLRVTVLSMAYRDYGFWFHQSVETPTDQARPDVVSAYSDAPPDSGFDSPIGIGRYAIRVRLACAYAPDVGAAAGTTRFLGCAAQP